jgi:uncharacterized protein YciI
MPSHIYISTKLLITSFLIIISLTTTAQPGNNTYDKKLADSLQADEYGMKSYVLVMLKGGAEQINDKAKTDSIFRGHLQNIRRLANEGKLIVAGPLQTNAKGYRGIFILNVKTSAEAKTLLDTDPAIQAKLLDSELYEWYESAALPMYLPYSKKVEKKSF